MCKVQPTIWSGCFCDSGGNEINLEDVGMVMYRQYLEDHLVSGENYG